ncbi:PA2169 family four-helix-bundle protein [Telluribacter sp. SYSU D00476]|uniref:ferritin-like domain-containing protein n=1 Tax=Telluribacter sp. SYSU D00476 TaxID=2811430 RepID=UPI001FF47244|nr:PA2169 family four-helix-bundle protein [Telluribacter sp. SYSU D00476]
MENSVEKAQKELRNLIKLHYDRIEGYERAKDDTKDADLKSLFTTYANQSREFKTELSSEMVKYGGEVPEDNKLLGDLHKAWMDLKAAITNNDRESVLSSCEFGEQTIVGAYEDVLKYDNDDDRIPMSLRTILQRQYETVKSAYSRIRQLHSIAD